MKIAVRYHTRGGNTKTAADAIANVAGVKAEPIDMPLEEPVDILFVGGGFYGGVIKGDLDSKLRDYLEKLDPKIVKSVAAFSTAGAVDAAKRIAAVAGQQGINVHSKTLPLKVGPRNHRTFIKQGFLKLTDKELDMIDAFVKAILN